MSNPLKLNDGRILFFSRDRQKFPFLSNFYHAPFELNGKTWPSVEHYYQYMRSADITYRKAILAAHIARDAKIAARVWTTKNPQLFAEDSEEARLATMRKAVEAKFRKNTRLASLLLDTGTLDLVEDSPTDDFWGTGADGYGLNMLGKILMDTRARLRASEDV